MSLEKLQEWTEKTRDRKWHTEEILMKYGLLDKVLKHESLFSCPLCEKKFQSGDLCNCDVGIPIHDYCLKELEKKE